MAEGSFQAPGSAGPGIVPISAQVDPAGQVTINNIVYNKFTVNLTSNNGQSQTVSMSVPSGCSVNPTSVSINPPLAGTCTVFVPASNTGSVSATASESGYTSKPIQIQAPA